MKEKKQKKKEEKTFQFLFDSFFFSTYAHGLKIQGGLFLQTFWVGGP